jgi:serine/threonine protein kinase
MKSLAPNTLIQNRYLIVHLIGKGGMGEVYLAVDQRLGSAVALKRTLFADDEMLGNAFEREARTLARLRHPVLPKVSDHFTEDSGQYLVMEHIAGDDLSKRLEAAQKPFPTNWVLYWADQLLDALAYLHSHEPPIIHRDIKPQNLKLTDDNQIVLLDFGLSKNTSALAPDPGGSGGSTGSVVGYTPHYAPMEQIRGTGTGPRSDMYSLSATLYQLLSNTVPADALTRADAMLNGDADPVKPINEINPEVSPAVSEVILQGMAVTQDKRFTNAKEMQRSLRKAYTQVQDAMSANTIAFNSADALPGPNGESSAIPSLSSGEEATRVRGEQAASSFGSPAPPPEPLDMNATVRYSAPLPDVPMKQADVKTEVYSKGQIPVGVATGSEPAKTEVIENFTPSAAEPAGSPINDTPPAFAFDQGGSAAPTAPPEVPEFFTTPNVPPDPFATRTAGSSDVAISAALPVESTASTNEKVAAAAAPPKKKSSKGMLVAAVLGTLFVLSLAAAGAGWFVYSNYYAGSKPSPTPAPTPEPSVLPTPEPTIESAAETNNNTASNAGVITGTETNTNANTGDLTAAPTPETGDADGTDRTTSQTQTKKAPSKTTQGGPAGPKAAPKPKTNPSRPDILQ